MRIDGVVLIEGSNVSNFTVVTGTSYPSNPTAGELYFRTDSPNVGLYVHDGTAWGVISTAGSVTWSGISGTPTTLSGYGITDAVSKAGSTMNSAANLVFNGGTVTGIPTPSGSTDATNKAYVDAAVTALNIHGSVEVTTTTNLTATYSNGTAGVGATLTNSGTQAAISIDGYSPIVGARILVKNQTTATQNGIYVVTTVGSGSVNWVLTRATDSDNSIAGELAPGDFVFVSEGSTQANTGWTETAIGAGAGDSIVIGTDSVAYTQFSGAGTYLAGTGLSLAGSTFNVNLGAGIAELPSTEVGIDVHASGGLMTTVDNSASSTNTAAQLALTTVGTSGTYFSVTTDSKGRVTAGTNPTTLSGFGITDAVNISSTQTVTGTKNFSNITSNSYSFDTLLYFDMTLELQAGANGTFTLNESSSIKFQILGATYKTDSGTISANVRIGTTSVTGLSAISLTTTQGTATATAENTVNIGNRVNIVTSANTTGVNVVVTLACKRIV